MKKSICSFMLVIAMLCSMLPHVVLGANARVITQSSHVSGSDFTRSEALAAKLDAIFNGNASIYSNSSCTNLVNTALGTYSVPNNGVSQYVGPYGGGALNSGTSCWIYANGVYYTLFGEALGNGTPGSNSNLLDLSLTASRTLTFENMRRWGVSNGVGAQVRVGTHSLIILGYDSTKMIYLDGNGDGNGLIAIREETWAEIQSGYNTRGIVQYIIQPKNSYMYLNYPGYAESAPIGAYDVATGGVNSVNVYGWAFDPDTPNDNVEIHVYVDGKYIGNGIANIQRTDVNAVYGCGDYHGFDITLPVSVTSTGTYPVQVYAINTTSGAANLDMGAKEVTITAHTHSYTEEVTKNPTCSEGGTKTFTCQDCQDVYTDSVPALGHDYTSKVTNATCATPKMLKYTCISCGDTYVEYDDVWSEWLTEYPTGVPENLIEEKTQYSTLEKEYTTSTSNTLDGWTYCGTTYGDWGAVQTTTTKLAESDTLRITQTAQTGWGYYHWCNYYYNGGNNWNVDSVEYGSPCYWHGYTSSFELPVISFQDQGGEQAYGGTGSGAVHCDYNFYIWFRNTGADVYTYSYQTRSVINQFYKWSDKWSDWSDEEVTSNEDCQVKTQTVYRHYIGELLDHSYSYAVTNAPTSDTTGSLSGTCENCSDTMIVPLPMLDTTDYSYRVIAEPSGTQTGIGRYTWKTADYGTIYFDVEIACTLLRGDFDQDDSVTDADALYLLRYTLFPDRYPISQDGDVDGDGTVTDADALYLLRYTLFPERYPLKT